MRTLRITLIALVTVAGLTLVLAGGCKKSEPQTGGGAPPTTPQQAAKVIKPSSYSDMPLVGRITYSGTDNPQPSKVNPMKAPCPAEALGKGWYLNKDKAVRYTLVFLKPSAGYKFPSLSSLPPNLQKGGDDLEINQPDCHFEPRVSVLHPNQNLKLSNTKAPDTAHDALMKTPSGRHSVNDGGNMPVGKIIEIKHTSIQALNEEPYMIYCNQHTVMTGWLWKMDHPWAAVSDADGRFVITSPPVLGGTAAADGAKVTLVSAKAAGAAAEGPAPPAKLELWVWNEMLGGKASECFKKIDVDVEKALAEGKPIDIKLP